MAAYRRSTTSALAAGTQFLAFTPCDTPIIRRGTPAVVTQNT
jgi:molybdopterin-guanine dinucleotide biosynthesis protein A